MSDTIPVYRGLARAFRLEDVGCRIREGRRGICDMWAGCHPTDDSAGDRRQQQNTTRRFRW